MKKSRDSDLVDPELNKYSDLVELHCSIKKGFQKSSFILTYRFDFREKSEKGDFEEKF